MLDREKIVAVLKRRFPGAGVDQVAAAANAIVGLDDEWEELTASDFDSIGPRPAPCRSVCYLVQLLRGGGRFRVYRRRSGDV